MLIRNPIRNEYLEDRLQEVRVERKWYMNQAKLAILLFFVSFVVCQELICNVCNYTRLKVWPEAHPGRRGQ